MKKYENFVSALRNLNDIFQREEPFDNIETAGMVALFEICFEQSWKCMKEVLENYGYGEAKTGSPKQVIKTAFQAGIVRDEELWLDALKDRNNVAHSYNEAVAKSIIQNTKERYYTMFTTLRETLEAGWI